MAERSREVPARSLGSHDIQDNINSIARLVIIAVVVFIANAALLVLQLVGGRLLAPVIGSSLETWTAVIGMFLAGISAGNWYGGKLADRAASGRLLRRLIWCGAIAFLWALTFAKTTAAGVPTHWLPLQPRIAILAFVVCFPAAFVLSMTTPMAIKLLLPDVRRTGRVVGIVYALGTLGSLIGNFYTGFYLMAEYGVTVIVLGVAGILFVLGCIVPSKLVAEESIKSPDQPQPTIERSLALPVACGTVFIASFCAMALEMIASRLLAASHGVSIYTWTGIIGVVLAGTMIGNTLGGWIADRLPRRETLGASLFWAGFFTALIILSMNAVPKLLEEPTKLADDAPVWSHWFYVAGEWVTAYLQRWNASPLPWQIVGAAGGMFFLPMIAFGTISPQATRLAVHDWQHAGRVAGRVYAWSCAGAIAGTFATGWLLIGMFGSLLLILIIAAAIMLLSVVIGAKWRNPVELIGVAVILAAMGLLASFGADKYLSLRPNSEYAKESNYYLIGISYVEDVEASDSHLNVVLDQLIHSRVYGQWEHADGGKTWKTDVSRLGYGHEWVQSEFARAAADLHEHPQVMVIGGGGYTLPRWLDKFLPQVGVDVVEIDPAVTEAVYAFLGMPRDTKIHTHNMDGRQFVQERTKPGSYHLIIQDAVNDLSVPYHIMTREYNAAVKKALTPDGVFLLTIIDDPSSPFFHAAVRTMQESFPNVCMLSDWEVWTSGDRGVYVIAGTPEPFEPTKLESALARQGIGNMKTKMMPADELAKFLGKTKPMILTDDYAPVDNLIAETFIRR
jgi:spermidine synthase/MFS family permease